MSTTQRYRHASKKAAPEPPSNRPLTVQQRMAGVAAEVAAKRQIVPNFVRNLLCILLVIAAAVSVPFLGEFGPLPTTTMLDGWVLLFVFVTFVRGRIETVGVIGFLVIYLMTRIIPVLYNDSPLEDFAQAYRWILYLVAFALAVGRHWGTPRGLVRVMWVLLGLAFIKALLTFAVRGPGERPGLLLENNFELALFAGLVICLYRFLGRGKFWAVLLMAGLTVLAGSRSGAIAFLILAVFAISQIKGATLKQLLVLVMPLLALVPLWIFQQRTVAGRQVDRLNFLDVFLEETSKWDLGTWIVGTEPITPLALGSCSRLSYYRLLFSSEGDGSCYSVILHAFLMRVVFDAGIVGLVIAFGITWWMMRKAKVQFAVAFSLILVAGANSASVSGLNNPYVALPILLAILTTASVAVERKRRPQYVHGPVPLLRADRKDRLS